LPFTGAIAETSVLGTDCTPGAVLQMLQGYPPQTRILCVGHEPDMSQISAVLLDGEGRSAVAFQPGSILGLTFQGQPLPGRGTLRFFLRPVELLALLAGKVEG
jgi:phosphohistidine phosphatase SixA